jgi:AraC-like DNA-binding protein
LSQQLSSVRLDEGDWGLVELYNPGGAKFAGRRPAFIHIVVSGSIFLSLDGRSAPVELKAGSSAFVFGRHRHSLRTEPDAPVTMIRYFDESRAGDRLATIRVGSTTSGPLQRCVTGAFDVDRLTTMRLSEILPEMAQGNSVVLIAPGLTPRLPAILSENLGGPGVSAYLNRLADLLLVQAIRKHADWSATRARSGKQRLKPEIERAIRLMTTQPARAWTVASLADIVMMSRSAFASKFSASVGEPPIAHLTRIRMNRAAELIARTDQSLTAVATSLGYSSFSSFNHLFKRWHGETPGRFRKKRSETEGDRNYLQSSHWQVFE